MVKEYMTLGQFLDRPVKPAKPRRPVLLFRIPGGKNVARMINYILN
jgi:hypothetical protein